MCRARAKSKGSGIAKIGVKTKKEKEGGWDRKSNVFTALNNFISKTVIHRKEKYNTYINANLNGKNNCWITKGKNALTIDKLN